MDKTNLKVLGFLPLLALVVGSIVGAGIFNSPADLGRLANPGWILIAWMVTAVGIFSLVRVFQYLSFRRSDLEGGIYSYAREVGGEFVGFNSAYGYWWSAMLTNLAYLFAIPKILSNYLPILAKNKWAACLVASVLLWSYYGLIRAGIKIAGMANVLITGLKLAPLLFVVGVTLFMFSPRLFTAPFSSILSGTGAVTPFSRQIGGSFGIMVFTFLGIESAVVISSKARNPRHVGPVTLIGFLITLVIYVLVSTLTLGVAPAREIVQASSPLGAVLGHAVGDFGRHFLNFGFLFSVLGAFLAWLLLAAENPFVAAMRDGAFPRAFTQTNRRATPVFSLTVSVWITQALLLILILFSASADISAPGNTPLLQNLYFAAINISVICALLPYVCAAVLGIRLGWPEKRSGLVAAAVLGIVFFSVVLLAMLKYAAAAVIIYATGLVFRLRVHRERGQRIPPKEIVFFILMLAAGAAVLYFVVSGRLQF